jgi:hypothetical protein
MRARGRARNLAALAALALLAGGASAAQAAPSAYDQGLATGQQAYQYGVPLLDMTRIFQSSTSINVPDGLGHGPVNRFAHVRRLSNADETTVVAPNNDTLYSMAWLDLSKQPQVLHAPPVKNRFWEFELVDPWTNNFFNITSAHRKLGRGDFRVTGGGDWAIVPPGFKGKLPKGVQRVSSPYDRVWVIGRTYIKGPSDLKSVHRIQNRYSITPLSKFGTGWHPKPPRHPDTDPSEATIPGTQTGDDPLDFYSALGRQMKRFPPPKRDKPILSALKPYGIGTGLDPNQAELSAGTLTGLSDAVTQGPARIQADVLTRYFDQFEDHNGYLIHDLGDWGTNYALRAIGDRVGVGGQRASIATYPFALTDSDKAFLTGSNRYVLHIPAGDLPVPVRAFWSLTLYDSSGFFVPNSLNRYVINNRSNLHKNSNGSIDLYIQHDEPTTKSQRDNWLPAPAPSTTFRLIWRLYDLDGALDGVLDGSGWQPPAIQHCDNTGHGPLGTACAS